MAILCLHSFISGAAGQNIGQGASAGGAAQGSPSAGTAAEGPGQDQSRGGPRAGGPASLSGVLPSVFKRHLVSRFSVGQAYEKGIYNSNLSQAEDTYTEASASFLYELNGKHSDYTFDYAGSARHYNRFSGLDVVSHEAGLGQVVRWSSRLITSLRYRFSLTPYRSAYLPQESISRELSLASPSAVPELLAIPTEQRLVSLRSVRMMHNAAVNLSYQASLRTRFSIAGAAGRTRYQDNNLFGSDQASISAQVQRSLTSRTSVGIVYQGAWFRQPGGMDRTIVHSGSLLMSRQLTPHMTVSITGGRWWSYSAGKDGISLSPVLSDLLGTPALIREASRSFSSWTGSANLLTHWQWNKVNFDFTYARSIANTNLLERPADTQSFTLSLGRQLGRYSSVTGSIAYQQNDFFTLQNLGRLDQGVAQVDFARNLTSGLDFSIFFNSSKILRGSQEPFLFNHTQAGVRFVLYLPRVRPS